MANRPVSPKTRQAELEGTREHLKYLNRQKANIGLLLAGIDHTDPSSDYQHTKLRSQLAEVNQLIQECDAKIMAFDAVLANAADEEAKFEAAKQAQLVKLQSADDLVQARQRVANKLPSQIAAVAQTLATLEELNAKIKDATFTAAAVFRVQPPSSAVDLLMAQTGAAAAFETLLWMAGLGKRGLYLPNISPRNITDVPFEAAVDRVSKNAAADIEAVRKQIKAA